MTRARFGPWHSCLVFAELWHPVRILQNFSYLSAKIEVVNVRFPFCEKAEGQMREVRVKSVTKAGQGSIVSNRLSVIYTRGGIEAQRRCSGRLG
jgi:hypothetical protein